MPEGGVVCSRASSQGVICPEELSRGRSCCHATVGLVRQDTGAGLQGSPVVPLLRCGRAPHGAFQILPDLQPVKTRAQMMLGPPLWLFPKLTQGPG